MAKEWYKMKLKDLCFEIIQKCPNKCLFCSSCSSINDNYAIDYQLFTKVIDHFMKLGGIEEISLSGGEPFLHPDILNMVKYCKQNNIKTTIYTSGITFRQKLSAEDIILNTQNVAEQKIVNTINQNDFDAINKNLLSELKQAGLDKIVFDFQSSGVNGYNVLMGTKNMSSYVAKSMIVAGIVGLDTEIHFIPLKSNFHEIKDIIELAEIAEAKQISILRFIPQGRGNENAERLMLSDSELKSFIKEVINIKSTTVRIRMGIPLTEEDNHLCTAGYQKLIIKYDGTVLPCPAFKEYDAEQLKKLGIIIPNINENLEEICFRPGTREKPLCKQLYFLK